VAVIDAARDMSIGQEDLVKVAVVQAAPVAFDRDRTLEKVHALAADAARQGAHLVLFPEAFVSAYPRSGRPLEPPSNRRPRGMITAAPASLLADAAQNPAYRPAHH